MKKRNSRWVVAAIVSIALAGAFMSLRTKQPIVFSDGDEGGFEHYGIGAPPTYASWEMLLMSFYR